MLTVKNLTGGYGQTAIIKNINFDIAEGEVVGLIGLNGAGKSTTIKHILGILQPMSGSISLNDLTLSQQPEQYKQQFSYIPETPVLYDELTLQEHINMTSLAYCIPKDVADQRANELLKTFDLLEKKDFFPIYFSKGMKQKVMITCAFLVEPQLFIIDEPFLGLDPIAISQLLMLIQKQKQRGASILMSTHILATAEKYCDKFLIIHKGQLVAQGTLEDLRQQTQLPHASLDDIYITLTTEEVK